MIKKQKNLEDSIIYADFDAGKYRSVFEQLQTDIDIEEAYCHLNNDVTYVKNKEGELVIVNSYKFTTGNDIYVYEAGTTKKRILEDMCSLYSKGNELVCMV